MNAAGVFEQEADWYLLMAGVERELNRLATIGVVSESDAEV